MNPEPGPVLAAVADALRSGVAPDVRSPFGQQLAILCARLAEVLAQEVDRMPERLHEENEAVTLLLADAIALIAGTPLAARIARTLAAPTRGLRISMLQARNDVLRAVLTDVHAAIEAIPGPEARAFDERIWTEYRASVERRHVEVGP